MSSPPSGQYPGAEPGREPDPATRPGQVTAAAIIGIVIGGLNAFSLLGLSSFFEQSVLTGMFALAAAVVGLVMLVGGIQVLRGGRVDLLLTGAYAAIALNAVSIVWNLLDGVDNAGLGVIGFLFPVLIVVFLRQNAVWSARRT